MGYGQNVFGKSPKMGPGPYNNVLVVANLSKFLVENRYTYYVRVPIV